jgi:hypothetical protein
MTGICQQNRVTARELLMQAVHLATGNGQHLLQTFATFQHTGVFQHGGRHGLGGVEVIVLKTAQPGSSNGRVGAGAVLMMSLALGNGQDLLGMSSERITVHFYCSSKVCSRGVATSILFDFVHCNACKGSGGQAVPHSIQSVTLAVPELAQGHPPTI